MKDFFNFALLSYFWMFFFWLKTQKAEFHTMCCKTGYLFRLGQDIFLKINFPFLGISRLRGTTLYELFLTLQQRGLNWYHSANRGAKDILSVFQVQKKSGPEKLDIYFKQFFLRIILLVCFWRYLISKLCVSSMYICTIIETHVNLVPFCVWAIRLSGQYWFFCNFLKVSYF